MTPLVPVALFGWVPFTIYLFFTLKPHHAVLVSVIGGTLFLPMAAYDLPGLPPFTKNTAISLGLILGGRLSGRRSQAEFQWKSIDLPMLLWCLTPMATSLSNHLGWYDGVSGIWNKTMMWGIPYFSGRIYFDTHEKLKDICLAFVIGGLIYIPLCLYEVRMSPQLSNKIYGFFPHTFAQHRRYGGFRPIVFMQHGLMVSLWMATTTTVAFWLWRSGIIKSIKMLPMVWFVPLFVLTTILCKSVNGWFAMLVGCGGYFLYKFRKSVRPFQILMLVIPLYMALRIGAVVEAPTVTGFAAKFVTIDRVNSLEVRLREEDLFIQRILHRPLLGWGPLGRAWPTDPETGNKIKVPIDALWLIAASAHGMLGLGFLFIGMLSGPWQILRRLRAGPRTLEFFNIAPMVLSLVVTLFLIDSLANAMFNPVYILVSGALSGYHLAQKETAARPT